MRSLPERLGSKLRLWSLARCAQIGNRTS